MSLVTTQWDIARLIYTKFLKFIMMRKISRCFYFFILILFLSSISYSAEVEIFSEYNTVMQLNKNNTIDIHKTIALQNVHEVGIVPGEIEFKIGKSIYSDVSNVNIQNFKATNRYGNPINAKLVETDKYSIITLDIFTPVLPGFEYRINLDYSLIYEPEGIFFKRLQVPLKEDTQIPIERGTVELIIPSSYHFTYLSYIDNDTIVEDNTIKWELNKEVPDSLIFEYSYLPVKIGNIQGSYIFWITINVILIFILFLEIRKEVKKFKN